MEVLCKNPLKLITNIYIIMSIFVMLCVCNLAFNKHAIVNAAEISNSYEAGIKQISSSYGGHTIFAKYDGTVWGCGNNNYGQLGIGNTTSQLSPIQIPIDNVKDFECGKFHTSFLKNDGTVWACGNNDYGQLGIDSTTSQPSPVQIPINNVKDIKCGRLQTVFIKNDGTVWTCGRNDYGQLGIGNNKDIHINIPIQVPITDIKDIYFTGSSTIFLKNDGTVWGCGNGFGELGIDSYLPTVSLTKIPITNVKKVAVGIDHSIFLKTDGSAWASGHNNYKELGIENVNPIISLTQIPITDIKDIECEDHSTIFFKSDGTILGCGDNTYNQLGLSTTQAINSLVQLPITNVKQFICASCSTYIIKNDNSIWGCGRNIHGELGIGDAENKSAFVNLQEHWITEVDKVTNAVIKAETSKLQLDVNAAQTLVTTLPSSITKIDLSNRLIVVQTYIATTKVTTVENTKMEADVDSAQVSINLLSENDTNRIALQNRLDIVKLYIATSAVANAEISNQQIHLDKALSLVNDLTMSTEKTNLLTRLANVQNIINNTTDLTNASGSVVKAETSKQQIYVDRALSLVNLLPESTDKTDLSNRLLAVQNSIDLTNAISAVTKAETSKQQVAVDKAISSVTDLPDSTDKTNLLIRLAAVQNIINNTIDLTNASSAVVKAETIKQQIYVDRALSLVNVIPESTDKTTLLNRLVTVQNYIDLTNATTAVAKAETSKRQIDVDKAISLVTDLSDSTDKTNLLTRLANIQNIINNTIDLTNAITAVTKAKDSKLQVDVDRAKGVVISLPSSTDKDNLLNELVKVQNIIDLANATNSVVKAETSNQQLDVDISKSLVDALPDSTNKTNLSNRLVAVQNLINYKITLDNATKAVGKAEEGRIQLDIERAINLVNALPASTEKTNLLDRLGKFTDVIVNPVDVVGIAEQTKLQKDVDKATLLVNALENSQEKIELHNRLMIVQNIIDLKKATNAVIVAEEIKTQLYVDNATALVNNLQNSTEKIDLIKRLTIVQSTINLNNAQGAVSKAEASLQQSDLDNAKNLAMALPVSSERSKLLNRLVNVQNSINLANAKLAVSIAEGSKRQADLDAASKLVNILPDTLNKTDLLIKLSTLQNTIDLIAATKVVELAEATNSQSDVNAAKALVINLPTSTGRTSLLDRLAVVQNKINVIIATDAVSKAEITRTQVDVDTAMGLVIPLLNNIEKTNLSNRLVNVQNMIDIKIATNAVIKAEESKLQIDVDAALILVNDLSVISIKDSLLNRLSIVQGNINLTNATNAVIKAEGSNNQADVDLAKTSISLLPQDSPSKSALQERVNVVQAYINNVNIATDKVTIAESTKAQVDIDIAQRYIDKLPMNDVNKELLQQRLVLVKAYSIKNN